ncbi:MAG: hypothetical protein M1830_002847, partial [Pleopsidium flavum]
ILWKNAQDIAATYSTYERAKYQAAAVTFRIPYWDWASNPMMPAALSAYHSTVRYPNSAGQSQPDLVNKQLLANGAALRTLTYQLIAQESSYAPFSNTGYTDGRGGLYNSLENMHNAIHGLVGNGGHMGSVPYSAFDPIFWLHHANVDRLFAIWQAIYPDSFVTYQTDSYGTYTNAPGGAETADTRKNFKSSTYFYSNTHPALTPFHATALGVLYTSTTARYTKTFGYTYPEIIDWNISTTQLSTNVRTKLNALYNSPNPISKRHTSAATKTTTTRNSTTTHHHHHQYFINIRVASNALTPPSSSFIHFFLGSFPDNPRTWSYDPALIASHTVIASLYPPSLPNSTTYGQIPLSHSLLAAVSKGTIPNLHPANVIPLLKRELQWRVQRFDDSAVDVEEVRGLKMQVVGQEVRDIGEGGFPGFGEMVVYWEVS